MRPRRLDIRTNIQLLPLITARIIFGKFHIDVSTEGVDEEVGQLIQWFARQMLRGHLVQIVDEVTAVVFDLGVRVRALRTHSYDLEIGFGSAEDVEGHEHEGVENESLGFAVDLTG